MNILTTEYSLSRRTLEVYLAGCTRRCPGCHNPETWDFDRGVPFVDALPMLQWKLASPLVQAVWVLGGEPLDQDLSSLRVLLERLREAVPQVWLFTSYEIEEVPAFIQELCSFVKTGRYLKDLPAVVDSASGLTLGSGNQKVWNIS